MTGEIPDDGMLSVGGVAEALGTTVRTLHYWEIKGLITASGRNAVGHRRYAPEDLLRAQRVRTYRDLGFSLEEIRSLLQGSGSQIAQLRLQRGFLEDRIRRTRSVLGRVERMLRAAEQGISLTPDEQMRVFGGHDVSSVQQEARDQWGNTDQWHEYVERTGTWSEEQWSVMRERMTAWEADLAAAVNRDEDPSGHEAAELAERHRQLINSFYSCPYSRHVLLARMYTEDDEWRAHYENLMPGSSRWLRKAIESNAVCHGVVVDEARWD